MKKILYFTCIGIFLFEMSCSQKSVLVGTWISNSNGLYVFDLKQNLIVYGDNSFKFKEKNSIVKIKYKYSGLLEKNLSKSEFEILNINEDSVVLLANDSGYKELAIFPESKVELKRVK